MAESNANRPDPDALSAEDADRMSERFRPSWEAEASSPVAAPARPEPRPEPARPVLKQTLLGGTGPAPLTPQAAPPAQAATPVARPAEAPKAAPPAATRPAPTVNVGPAQAGGTAAAVRRPRQGTLIGVAPQAPRPSAERAPAHHDDLDWELPAHVQAQADALVVPPEEPKAPAIQPHLTRTQPLGTAAPALNQVVNPAPAARAEPEDPMPVEVEELPPESKPSGIGHN